MSDAAHICQAFRPDLLKKDARPGGPGFFRPEAGKQTRATMAAFA